MQGSSKTSTWWQEDLVAHRPCLLLADHGAMQALVLEAKEPTVKMMEAAAAYLLRDRVARVEVGAISFEEV